MAERMGAAAARYVRGTFGWDGVAQQFLDACMRLGARSPHLDGDPVGARA